MRKKIIGKKTVTAGVKVHKRGEDDLIDFNFYYCDIDYDHLHMHLPLTDETTIYKSVDKYSF